MIYTFHSPPGLQRIPSSLGYGCCLFNLFLYKIMYLPFRCTDWIRLQLFTLLIVRFNNCLYHKLFVYKTFFTKFILSLHSKMSRLFFKTKFHNVTIHSNSITKSSQILFFFSIGGQSACVCKNSMCLIPIHLYDD